MSTINDGGPADDIKLPEPHCYIYERDTPFGVRQSTDNSCWNGRIPDRSVPVYTADQLRAAVKADRAHQAAEIERLRKDAALLDWLDAKNARFRMGWRVGQAPIGNVNVHAIVQLGTSPLTSIRAAIDAAIEAAHGITAPKGGSEP